MWDFSCNEAVYLHYLYGHFIAKGQEMNKM